MRRGCDVRVSHHHLDGAGNETSNLQSRRKRNDLAMRSNSREVNERSASRLAASSFIMRLYCASPLPLPLPFGGLLLSLYQICHQNLEA
jgi:hypothetical protein